MGIVMETRIIFLVKIPHYVCPDDGIDFIVISLGVHFMKSSLFDEIMLCRKIAVAFCKMDIIVNFMK